MSKKHLEEQIKLIISADHWDPFQVLGIHAIDGEENKVAVRAFMPEAEEAWVVDDYSNDSFVMNKINKAGFFEAIIDKKRGGGLITSK